MIRDYLLTAFRNLFRNKGFSFINIFGLSLSMSVCMFIIVIILDQYSYDSQIREYYGFFEDVLYAVRFTSILTIVIASLGLYGMATYSTQTRLKEIGIRNFNCNDHCFFNNHYSNLKSCQY